MLDPKDCFACRYPEKYDIDSIKWFLAEKKLCQDHIIKAEAVIANPPESKLKITIKPKEDRKFSEKEVEE